MPCCAAGCRWTAFIPVITTRPTAALAESRRRGCCCRRLRTAGIDLPRSFMVGDRWSDIVAGWAAGCRSMLIGRPYSDADRCSPDRASGRSSRGGGVDCAVRPASAQRLASMDRVARSRDHASPATVGGGRMRRTEDASRALQDFPTSRLRVKIFADGADREGMIEMARQPWIAGLTTNPTLLRKAGVERLPRLRAGRPVGHSRQADLLRGAIRRLRGDGAAGDGDRLVGGERIREDSGDEHGGAGHRSS